MRRCSRAGAGSASGASGKPAATAVDFPPMQDPASFNPSEVKKQVDELIKAHEEQ